MKAGQIEPVDGPGKFWQPLQGNGATWVCLLLAIMVKCTIAWMYTDLEGDKTLYLLFAQSLLDTGFMAEPLHLVGNSGPSYFYNPAIVSPFYSLLAAPFLWATGSYFATQFMLTGISWILFFGAVFCVARLLFKTRLQVNLFLLFAGFFLYPHELASTPKDSFAVAFTLWSFVFAHRFLTTRPRFRTTFFLFLSIALFCLTKLLYVLLAPVLLLFLFLVLLRKKSQRHFVQFGWLMLLLLITVAVVYLTILRPAQQQALPMTAWFNDGTTNVKGFYPQNLLRTFPFVTSSFINTNFWGVQAERLLPLSFSAAMHIFRLVDAVVLVVLAVYLRRIVPLFVHRRLFWIFLVAALSLTSAVLYLSLTHAAFAYKSSTNEWTYVTDARSFLLILLLLQSIWFVFISEENAAPWLRRLLFVLLLAEAVHGLYFTVKEAVITGLNPYTKNQSVWKQVADLAYQQQQAGAVDGLLTTDIGLSRYARLLGASTFALTQTSPTDSLPPNRRFLVVTHIQDSAVRQKFPAANLHVTDTLPPFVVATFRVPRKWDFPSSQQEENPVDSAK